MRRHRSAAALAALLTLILAACSSGAGPTPSADERTSAPTAGAISDVTTGPNGEAATAASEVTLSDADAAKLRDGTYTAALLWAGASEWYNAVSSGAKDEFAKLGIEVVATAEANFDPAKQATDVETALARDPDIILTLVVDPVSGAQAFRPAVDAGKVLVFADNGADGYQAGREYVSIVTGNHFGMGRAAAELMNDALGGSGEVGFIFHDADFYVTNNRDNHFKKVVETEYPGLEIVAENGFTEEGATEEIASAMLIQHPEIKGIYVAWDTAAEGVVAALRAVDRSGVKVVTHDLGANNDLDMAKGGNVHGKVADLPFQIGQTMARLAAYKLLGKEAPPFVTVDLVKVTKENLVEGWQQSLRRDPPEDVMKALGQ